MAPQTRNRGNKSADGSYKSTTPAPKQKRFPGRRAQLKTYGSPRPTLKPLKQETLTQMQWVSPSMQEDLLKLEDEDEDEDDAEEPGESEVPPAVEVKSRKRTRGNRRKTAGDELPNDEKPKGSKRRKTLGDIPSPNPTRNFQTQTLTQCLDKSIVRDQVDDSEGDDDNALILETPKKPEKHISLGTDNAKPEQQPEYRSSVPTLIQSVTPTNKRRIEIPSSTSPLTPMLTRSFSPEHRDSPLKGKSTNAATLSPIIKTPSRRIIPDSYSTAHSSPAAALSTSTSKATPNKKLRFDLPEDKENITPGRKEPKPPKSPKDTSSRTPLQELPEEPRTDQEIPDSDYDSDATESTIVEDNVAPNEDNIPSTDDPEPAETCYGVIGDETQAEILLSADELSRELSESDSLEGSRSRSATPTPKPKKKEPLRTAKDISTPTRRPGSTTKQVQISSPQRGPTDENTPNAHTQIYTQGVESQRLPLEEIRALGPQTPNSDIMVSLHPEPLAMILDRSKNHEFRTWKIPPSVSRIWIYSTRPTSELRYMCILSPPKVPGEIQDEKGVGNVEFNQGTMNANFAYEIVQVYELNNPVPLNEMKKKGWVNSAPQKYIWVPPAVVGELTGNLKYALFGGEEQAAETATLLPTSPNVSESQEIKAQIQDDVDYSTQHPSSERGNDMVASSPVSRKSAGKRKQLEQNRDGTNPTPSKMLLGPSTRSDPAPSSERVRGFVRSSQATTVSSPTISPEKSLPQPINLSSQPSAINYNSSSPILFRNARNNSLRSSQFQTRSQMLPDSLINGEIQEPPPIIWDSADEESD
ncbi:uncharacterized protein F4822DRAFT_406331 [Hypoxylon trugodes]|uniref:uncharacterized protein n=1 Tax=Hypoxylon trugodes TaxID=326681 RepID=UPI00219A7244|nr:uncharacterized protein F4822DRAFT_406331 [Hypoxylon trugodes]KAI1387406.1 hypothetical protein F4822DRAFT_406331 [Hypoxylon trugodes]